MNADLKKLALFKLVMHMNTRKMLIWLVTFMTAGTAVYILLPTHWSYWWDVFNEWRHFGNLFESISKWNTLIIILFDVVLLSKLIAAYSLFKMKSWGRLFSIAVLGVDALMRIVGAINVNTWHLLHPKLYEEMKTMFERAPDTSYVMEYSIIPSYIITIISLVSIFILIQKPIKEAFQIEAHK